MVPSVCGGMSMNATTGCGNTASRQMPARTANKKDLFFTLVLLLVVGLRAAGGSSNEAEPTDRARGWQTQVGNHTLLPPRGEKLTPSRSSLHACQLLSERTRHLAQLPCCSTTSKAGNG